MTDLTEQWKKGELSCGWYYIKIADIVFIDFFEGKVWKNKKDKYIDEVLAEVPSYEEFQNQAFILKSRESDIVKNYAFNQENVEIEVIGNIHENADLLGEE